MRFLWLDFSLQKRGTSNKPPPSQRRHSVPQVTHFCRLRRPSDPLERTHRVSLRTAFCYAAWRLADSFQKWGVPLVRYGGSKKMGLPPAGWFMSWKMLFLSGWFGDTLISGNLWTKICCHAGKKKHSDHHHDLHLRVEVVCKKGSQRMYGKMFADLTVPTTDAWADTQRPETLSKVALFKVIRFDE